MKTKQLVRPYWSWIIHCLLGQRTVWTHLAIDERLQSHPILLRTVPAGHCP
jgi:hypothetical protein